MNVKNAAYTYTLYNQEYQIMYGFELDLLSKELFSCAGLKKIHF